jgi:hypothetical protein
MSDTTDQTQPQEAPEPVTEAASEPTPTTEPETTSEEPQDPQEGSEESASSTVSPSDTGSSDQTEESETPPSSSEPTVVNDENGQHVLVPQEDGSVRTVVTRSHTLPVSNAEQAVYEQTHTGDQPRYSLVPGDAGYSAYSDPAVPNSHLAQRVETEIVSFAERVLQDSKAAISPLWNSLKGVFEGELEQAIETGVATGKVEL